MKINRGKTTAGCHTWISYFTHLRCSIVQILHSVYHTHNKGKCTYLNWVILLWHVDLRFSVYMNSLILINFLMVTFGRQEKRERERNSGQRDIDLISPFFWLQLEPVLKDITRLLLQRRNRILAVPSVRESYPKVTIICPLFGDMLV